jgi:DnaK suppressor protein
MNMAHKELKSQLEEKLDTLQGRLASIKKDATQSHSVDSAEQAQERENDEVVDAIGNETAQSIRVLQAALSRIEDGSYGICENCGSGINDGRLAAIPEATRCVGCAD